MEDRFATMFPGEPTVREIQWNSEYGAEFPGRIHSIETEDRYFAVTVVDYSDSEAIHWARSNTTEADSPVNYNYWRIDVVASVAYYGTLFAVRTDIDPDTATIPLTNAMLDLVGALTLIAAILLLGVT